MKVYLSALLLLVGCGSAESQRTLTPGQEPRPKTTVHDQQVKEYYDEFVRLCDYYNSSTCATNMPKLRYIKIVDKKELMLHAEEINMGSKTEAVGLCVYYYNPKTNAIVESYVYLLDNNGYGENWFPEEVKALVFHELGHCLLRLDHPNPARPETDPAIMNYRMYSRDTYTNNWDSMVHEMFN